MGERTQSAATARATFADAGTRGSRQRRRRHVGPTPACAGPRPALSFFRRAARPEVALRIDPDHAEAHNNLGVVLLDQGRPREAATHFEVTLAVKPDHATARAGLARARTLAE